MGDGGLPVVMAAGGRSSWRRTHRLPEEQLLLGEERQHVQQVDQHGVGVPLGGQGGVGRGGAGRRGLEVLAQHADPVHPAEHLPKEQEAALGTSSLHLRADRTRADGELPYFVSPYFVSPYFVFPYFVSPYFVFLYFVFLYFVFPYFVFPYYT